MKSKTTKRILVAPLNWGLGHATRCIPIIQQLSNKSVEVVLASDGAAYGLLAKEFPELPLFRLPSYNIRYASHNMVFNMARQLPNILKAILREHRLIQKWIKELALDAVIADNRFGCYSTKIPCVIITHQLNIKVGWPPLERFTALLNHRYIRRFDRCWVPDFATNPTLSGDLSHPTKLNIVDYIGPLSRMKLHPMTARYEVIAVLSGPEPQRTYFEEMVIEQAIESDRHWLIVKGTVNAKQPQYEQLTPKVKTVSFLTTHALNEAILASDVVVARSGYTSIMDLVALGKKAILVPTPGQTEQIYLAKLFHNRRQFLSQSQHQLNLINALDTVQTYTGWTLPMNNDALTVAIDNLLE